MFKTCMFGTCTTTPAGLAAKLTTRRAEAARGATSATGARGFTIIELMVVLLVVGVLTALAYPSFVDQVRKGRRADAINAMAIVQQTQERWRGNRAQYTSALPNTAAAGQPANGLGLPTVSSSGYYRLSIPTANATEYIILATAVTGTSQALDRNCLVMGMRSQGGTLGYGSAAQANGSIDWTDAARCWAR